MVKSLLLLVVVVVVIFYPLLVFHINVAWWVLLSLTKIKSSHVSNISEYPAWSQQYRNLNGHDFSSDYQLFHSRWTYFEEIQYVHL